MQLRLPGLLSNMKDAFTGTGPSCTMVRATGRLQFMAAERLDPGGERENFVLLSVIPPKGGVIAKDASTARQTCSEEAVVGRSM